MSPVVTLAEDRGARGAYLARQSRTTVLLVVAVWQVEKVAICVSQVSGALSGEGGEEW